MNPPIQPRARLFDRAIVLLATGFGVGFLPAVPGTFGTLWGVLLAWGLAQLPAPAHWLLAALAVPAAVPICGRAEKVLGRHDPGSIVLDEIVAMPFVYLGVGFGWKTALTGFVLFRLFDVLKPWPVNVSQRLPGGLGVVADDVIAAVETAAVLALIAWWFPLG